MSSHLVVGIDFDNTLIRYDELIHKTAVDRGLIPASFLVDKTAIRDQIRTLPQGDLEWQKIQGLVYGPLILAARLFEGVESFLKYCALNNIKVVVISHKTEFASQGISGFSLRKAALDWMFANHFFTPNRDLGLSPNDIYFESTREGKIEKISQLGCDVFIDDLAEVFEEPGFPARVRKIFFSPSFKASQSDSLSWNPSLIASSWHQIEEWVRERY